jgi:DNA-binding NarL/FixJ family response regulator
MAATSDNRLDVIAVYSAQMEEATQEAQDARLRRRKAIQKAARCGVTYAEIGRRLNLSRARVWQIARGH